MKSIYILPLICLMDAACNNTRTVQLTINSNPPGAYTTFELDSPTSNRDANFLGNTPISITREVNVKDIPSNAEVALRAMRPGYFDGTKIYTM